MTGAGYLVCRLFHLAESNVFASEMAFVPFGLSMLITLSTWRPLRSLLEARPLVTVGKFAYSLYLMHLPLLTLVYVYVVHGALAQSGETPVTFLLVVLAGLPLTILGCYVFYLVFEKPFSRRFRRAVGRCETTPAILPL